MYRRVAIIGGGAAAAMLVSELLTRQPVYSLHIDWYTGTTPPPRGVAYSTPSDRHLLNVRAASMGMFMGKPGGFLDYARNSDPSVAGTDFLPRRRFGDYLETEVARALESGKANGHDVHIIPFAVDAIVPEPRSVTVIHGEESRPADAVVLAIGTLPPQPLPGVSTDALASGRYVVEPWHFLSSAPIEPVPRRITVIGLGLTAVDVLLELSARWPDAEFTAISRHGLLPEAHLPTAAQPLGDGAELIEAMLLSPNARQWMRLVREAVEQEGNWRTVVDSLRPHTPELWQELGPDQRARFMRHVRWAWERVRHRMAPKVFEAIAALEQNGRLQRRAGRLRAVDNADGAMQVTWVNTHTKEVQTHNADLVIQTTGLDTDVRRTRHPLVRQLLTNAHIVPDPLGLGVVASPDGRLTRGNGSWPNLFAIGNLMRGTHWESIAIPEIRQQARLLADQILTP